MIYKVLIAPLDWGLGHATRCIPLIKFLLDTGHEVSLAGNKTQQSLFKKEFPQLKYYFLEGYNISYSKNKRRMPIKILFQIPSILQSVKREHVWLNTLLKREHFDLIISDNRFGLYSSRAICIFITHQLQIQTPYKLTTLVIQWFNYKAIEKFASCWVPDFFRANALGGILSHPDKLPNIPVRYIGPLSRFSLKDSSEETTKKYDFLIILSGPEPQRTILEEKFLFNIENIPGRILLLRGRPGDAEISPFQHERLTILNHLDNQEMQEAILESEFVISRCGYTTVMEMMILQKKCILIPTPGQTEQEYLAQYLFTKRWCYSFNQDNDFKIHVKKALLFNYQIPKIESGIFKKELTDFLKHFPVNIKG